MSLVGIMGSATILLLFLFQITEFASVKEDSASCLSSYFEIQENKQLMGYVLKRFDSPSLLSCGRQCLRNAWCTSTNFKLSSKKDSEGTCELNQHNISTVNKNINFADQQGVTFSWRQKGCPEGWVLYGCSCYFLETPTLTWNDSRALCQTHGADLPIIRSAEENNLVSSLVTRQPNGSVSVHVWLGLHRKPDKDKEFYWVDGTPLAGQFSAWAEREPNNNAEECVFYYTKGELKRQWNDVICVVDPNKYMAPVVLCQKNLM